VKDFAALRLAILAGALALGAAAEAWRSRRPRQAPAGPRWAANLGLMALGTLAAKLLLPTLAVPFAYWAEERRLGLLHWISLPYALKFLLAFVWLDLVVYAQHRLFHRVPALWRLHRVHHADLDLDASSGVRFHPGEIVLSTLIKCAAIALGGAHFLAVAVFEIALNASSILSHAAVDLGPLDAPLRRLVVTPDYHRVHHSVERDETDSNFAFLISVWDRLFGTYRARPRGEHAVLPLGLPGLRDPRECASLKAMLALPLKDPR
jgi:sterol desaturase/sphingolipid hydroxylase (fatty acid hydroxylase superfamily)